MSLGEFILAGIVVVIVLGGCLSGLQDLTPEERSDAIASTSYDVIGQVITRVTNLNRAETLSDSDTVTVLKALDDLNNLVFKLESAADVLEGGSVTVECVTIHLSGEVVSACSQEDVTRILIDIRKVLDNW